MLPSNRMAAILNQAWLQSKVKKSEPKIKFCWRANQKNTLRNFILVFVSDSPLYIILCDIAVHKRFIARQRCLAECQNP